MTTFKRPLLFSVRQLAGDRSTVTNGRSLLHSYIHAGDSVRTIVWVFFAYKKIPGRKESRTRDRMYCLMIRSVRDIYRDDRARIATCTLRTLTDRNRENYSIDYYFYNYCVSAHLNRDICSAFNNIMIITSWVPVEGRWFIQLNTSVATLYSR